MDFVLENESDDLQKLNKEKLDQLEKRHRERLDQVNAKHESNKQNVAANENIDYFQGTFRKHTITIEDSLANLKPNTDRMKITQDINKIHEDTQILQDYLTTSRFFLSNYTIKACQAILNDLKSRIETAKETLLVKKKFNFRKKTDATSTKSVSSTVDGAANKSAIASISTAQDTHIQWTVKNRQQEEIILTAEETNNQDITVSTLDSCLLQISGYPGSLQLSNLTNCVILCGPVSRSVFADKCTNCKLIFGCQQLRFHTSHHCDLYMHVTCRAIIEDCNNINVAPYNYQYANLDDDFVKAGLNIAKNNWDHVADFNWLASDVQSPNWGQIAPEHRISCWNQYLNEFRQKILST